MAGTIAFSLSQQLDVQGAPLSGGLLYFFEAGTTTPQSAYIDSGLTLPHPNPIVLDAAGRVPQFFLADGSIKVRLTSAAGVTQIAADGILVIGASSGGGGGSPVDATSILATGDLKARYGTGVLSGFVRCNGRTIGSATSSATERANADTQALFEYLWAEDSSLSVSGGKGASAAADWSANKNMALPDGRGAALVALDDMGSSAKGVFAGATFTSGDATVLGSRIGAARRTLTANQLPVITPSGTISISPFVNSLISLPFGTSSPPSTGGPTINFYSPSGGSGSSLISATGTFTGSAFNPTGGQAFDAISPCMLITIYMKL